jgi:hypothetical protein
LHLCRLSLVRFLFFKVRLRVALSRYLQYW